MALQVVIVIETEYHFRNYLTGLVDFAADDDINYSLILPKDFASKNQLKFPKERTHFVEFGSSQKRLFLFIREINMLANARDNSGFMYSVLRSYPPILSLIKTRAKKRENQREGTLSLQKSTLQNGKFAPFKTIFASLKSLVHFGHRRLRFLIVRIFSIPVWSACVVGFLSKQVKEKYLIKKLEEINPDIVLYVTSLYEYSSIPLSRYCKQKKIKYILIPDNWDNLSTKRTLWEKPDYVGVWGNQGISHLEKIHRMAKATALTLGSPRMVPLLNKAAKAKLEKSYKTLLFVGSAIPYDECSLIQVLLKKVESSEVRMKLVYRPYPWRAHAIPREILEHRNFVLDKSIERIVLEKRVNDFDPKFDDYVNLLQESDLIVGGLSTMLLEAAIIGKQVLGLIHNDKSGSIDSPHLGFQYFEHVRGLEKFPNLILCEDLDNLWNLVMVGLNSDPMNEGNQFSEARNWFYNVEKNALFVDNLNENLKRVIQNH